MQVKCTEMCYNYIESEIYLLRPLETLSHKYERLAFKTLYELVIERGDTRV